MSLNAALIRRAVATPGLKLVMGSDAVAGAHGRNADELVERVRQGGQKPMDGIISATSLAAESLGLGKTIGRIAPGYQADIIAVDGDPTSRYHGAQPRDVRDAGGKDLQALMGEKKMKPVHLLILVAVVALAPPAFTQAPSLPQPRACSSKSSPGSKCATPSPAGKRRSSFPPAAPSRTDRTSSSANTTTW